MRHPPVTIISSDLELTDLQNSFTQGIHRIIKLCKKVVGERHLLLENLAQTDPLPSKTLTSNRHSLYRVH